MDKTKWTPGPWYVWNADGTDFTAIATAPLVPGKTWAGDAEVLGASEWLRCCPKDLALMAAAPDLYEELEALVDLVEERMTGRCTCDLPDEEIGEIGTIECDPCAAVKRLPAARAALAKARGDT